MDYRVLLSEILKIAASILKEKPPNSDISYLANFINSVTDYYRHLITHPYSFEYAYKGSQLFRTHLELMASLLESTSSDTTDPLNFNNLIQIQKTINQIFDPFLEEVSNASVPQTHIKSMNSVVNTLIYFKHAFPAAHIQSAGIETDIHDKIDMIISLPETPEESPKMLYIVLKATGGDKMTLINIKDVSDIGQMSNGKHQQDAVTALQYFKNHANYHDQLLFITAPNKIDNLPSILTQTATTTKSDPQTPHSEGVKLGILDRRRLGVTIHNKLKEELGTDSDDEVIAFAVQLVRQNPLIQASSWVRVRKGKEIVDQSIWKDYFEPAIKQYNQRNKK